MMLNKVELVKYISGMLGEVQHQSELAIPSGRLTVPCESLVQHPNNVFHHSSATSAKKHVPFPAITPQCDS